MLRVVMNDNCIRDLRSVVVLEQTDVKQSLSMRRTCAHGSVPSAV